MPACRPLALVPLCLIVTALLLALSPGTADCRVQERVEPKIPDIPGYLTLRCDFHMHTVFSDGLVWPTVRVEEAWREGLDAISITDHSEYLPHKDYMVKNLNGSYELARPEAEALGLLLIKGAEITKKVPPGHFNALFINDSNPLDHEDYLSCVEGAIRQGAFVFWNHPPFKQKDNRPVWHPEQTVLLEKGWLHGIEIANGADYCLEAHRWCLEKNLTLLGSTDIHEPSGLEYQPESGDRRTMTLVFATARTQEAIKEALFARRTAVFCRDTLYGDSRFLGPLFERSVQVVNPVVTVRGKGRALVQVRNTSDIPLHLASADTLAGLEFPRRITLQPDAVVLLSLTVKAADRNGAEIVRLPFRVENMHPAPGEALPVFIEVRVNFLPASEGKK
jgi:3',5'-nucleoside bisphosphate phosphatase